MAYNVLKGVVEGSVDQYGDQEIDGIKVFKNTISASVFYDTDAQSPCATMKDVAITEIKGGRPTSVLTYGGKSTVVANHNMVFDGNTLHIKNIVANSITGSGRGLHQLPPDEFLGTIGAKHLKHGHGLHDVRNILQVKTDDGLCINEGGAVGLALLSKGALTVKDNKVRIDPCALLPINHRGQNLSDDDLLMVADVSKGSLQHTTLSNLYDKYIKIKSPTAVGSPNEVQLKGKSGFASTSKLSYDVTRDVMRVEGKIISDKMEVKGTLSCSGAVINNIKTITDATYDVEEDDYTILCNSRNNPIVVTLPPACNSTGRVLVIKKANTDKYSIRSHVVKIKVIEGRIDINDETVLKMNYSSRILQSDGSNWWVLGTKGS